jgi:hypothetical protein
MVNRIVMNNVGLRVSKATYDVLTETNPNNFIFRADDGGSGIFMSGSVTGVTSATISFGITLPYIPFTMVTTKISGSTVSTTGVTLANTYPWVSTESRNYTGTVSTTSLVLPTLTAANTYYYAIFYMKAG